MRDCSPLKALGIGEARADPMIDVCRTGGPDATSSDIFFAITTDRLVRYDAIVQARRKTLQGRAPRFMCSTLDDSFFPAVRQAMGLVSDNI